MTTSPLLAALIRPRCTFLFAVFLTGALASSWGALSSTTVLAPMTSQEGQASLFTIPAPRGMICDRSGEILAYSRVAHRCSLHLPHLWDPTDQEKSILRVQTVALELNALIAQVELPTGEDLKEHWKNRPLVPFPLTPISTEMKEETLDQIRKRPDVVIEACYTREYPAGPAVSHLVGFTGRTMPDQHGPLGPEEPLWPTLEGRRGLEKSLEFLLHGEEGHLSVVYDQHGKELRRSLARAPRAGCTIITSLSLPLQKLATRILAESKRPGAFVAMNADTGEILAQASYPSFDNNVFLPAISAPRYEELTQHPGNLFFDRAVSGLYPPGSTFKPIVALATLESGAVLGTYTTFSGPPAYTVDGKVFRNWYKGDEGYLDVRFALLRSCNTWFYQAAIKAGSNPVLEMARRFGMGQMPALPLEGVAAGNLPAGAMGSRATANLSIGQGETLTSPLQMAIAMCAIANGKGLPSPQLIRQIQDPKTGESLRDFYPAHTPLRVRSSNLNDVRAGMWGVVNHSGGTGRSAALSSPKVYGKTGTSQWFVDGEERRLAWFTGFVQSTNPQIAFAVLSEGQPGESISGGGKAAPLAGKFLRTFYDNPSQYGFTPESLPKTDPLRIAATSLTSGSMQGNTATSDSLPTRFTFHPVAGIPKKANSSIYRKGTTNYNSGRFTVRARGLSKFSSRGGLFSRRRR